MSFKYNNDAGAEARSNTELYEHIEAFERQKVADLKVFTSSDCYLISKSMCTEFIHAQMHYHAKSLEIMTQAFAYFETINDEAEIKV